MVGRKTCGSRALRVCFRVGIFALGLGCRSSSIQQGPSDTLRAYARALDDGRADDAYKLLSSEAKRSLSLEAFRGSPKRTRAR